MEGKANGNETPYSSERFDTKVQYLKYKVLREVARYAFEDKLLESYTEIPKSS